MSFTSKNGKISAISNLEYDIELVLNINTEYALEIAQRENRDNSELVKMWKEEKGYNFLFLDSVYEWQLFVDYQANTKIISKKVTWDEAIKRATNHLIEKKISYPVNQTKKSKETKELYKLHLVSDIDGSYDVEIYQTATESSCEIVKMKITEARAKYLAEQLSKGEVISFKKPYWGLGKGWVAEIVGEKGKQLSIKITPNGKIESN